MGNLNKPNEEKIIESNSFTNEINEEPKKSSTVEKGTSENIVETLKSERARLRKALGDMFANECYRYLCSEKRGHGVGELDYFLDPQLREILRDETSEYIDDWVPILTKKFLNSYKYPNGKLYKLKLKLTEEEIKEVIENFVQKLCESRNQKISEGTREKYVKYKGALYGVKKKRDKDAEEILKQLEGC